MAKSVQKRFLQCTLFGDGVKNWHVAYVCVMCICFMHICIQGAFVFNHLSIILDNLTHLPLPKIDSKFLFHSSLSFGSVICIRKNGSWLKLKKTLVN